MVGQGKGRAESGIHKEYRGKAREDERGMMKNNEFTSCSLYTNVPPSLNPVDRLTFKSCLPKHPDPISKTLTKAETRHLRLRWSDISAGSAANDDAGTIETSKVALAYTQKKQKPDTCGCGGSTYPLVPPLMPVLEPSRPVKTQSPVPPTKISETFRGLAAGNFRIDHLYS